LKATISENDIRRGNMPKSSVLPKSLRGALESPVRTSLDARSNMRNIVASEPRVTPKDRVAIVVTVVVTVEIILVTPTTF